MANREPHHRHLDAMRSLHSRPLATLATLATLDAVRCRELTAAEVATARELAADRELERRIPDPTRRHLAQMIAMRGGDRG